MQAWRYVNESSQAVWRRMLSDWNVFNGVQQDNMNNLKMVSRSISGPVSLAYPIFYVESWAGVKHSRIRKNFPPPYLPTRIATQLIGSVPQSQQIKAS